jgi:hypothetical protein
MMLGLHPPFEVVPQAPGKHHWHIEAVFRDGLAGLLKILAVEVGAEGVLQSLSEQQQQQEEKRRSQGKGSLK